MSTYILIWHVCYKCVEDGRLNSRCHGGEVVLIGCTIADRQGRMCGCETLDICWTACCWPVQCATTSHQQNLHWTMILLVFASDDVAVVC